MLAGLLSEPGRPRLTWYGADGERVELSGAVLDNWVSKTVNLLVEEFDTGPGTIVRLDLPPHWRTVVWALAAWRAGATVDLAQDDGGAAPADVLVTDRPPAQDDGAAVVMVALPALARRWEGELPPGAIDAAAAVMTYGDQVGWAPQVDPAETALTGAGPLLAHQDLVGAARDLAGVPAGARALTVPAVGRDGASVRHLLLGVLGVLADGGSVVTAPDQGSAERATGTERVTARW